jgi:hypothetical protein
MIVQKSFVVTSATFFKMDEKSHKKFIQLNRKLNTQQKRGLVKVVDVQYDEEGESKISWINLQNSGV